MNGIPAVDLPLYCNKAKCTPGGGVGVVVACSGVLVGVSSYYMQNSILQGLTANTKKIKIYEKAIDNSDNKNYNKVTS